MIADRRQGEWRGWQRISFVERLVKSFRITCPSATGATGLHLLEIEAYCTLSDAESLKKKLAGTKWVNSNNVSFEWTRDGRFLHKGVERQWKVLDHKQVEIIFAQDHVDTLIFNESITEFKQVIKGGPDSFQGKLVE